MSRNQEEEGVQAEAEMNYPEFIECNCDNSDVEVLRDDSGWTATCGNCKRKEGPYDSRFVLYANWWHLVPAKEVVQQISTSMKPIVEYLESTEERVESSQLVKLGESPTGGRGALAILCESGLIEAVFVTDTPDGEQEMSMEEALKAKRIDRDSVRTYCTPKFMIHRLPLT